jgi:6-phosphogluconolactonase
VKAEVLCLPSVDAACESAATAFVTAAVDAIGARGAFMVALSGGTTPKTIYSRLATDERLRSRVNWEHVHFFWGDERHVPPDHPDSNFRLAREAMLDRLSIDPRRIWRIKGEYSDARQAADEYDRDLRTAFATSTPAPGVPRFDLVLLGMGPDGHTASLFPRTDALRERHRFVVANHVAELDTDRITLTLPVLNNSAEVLFVVHGANKADALQAVLEGPPRPDELPAQLISPQDGRVRWLVDPSAAQRLTAGGFAVTSRPVQ